ncbi:MAG: hypothetical protein ACRBC3_22335 [Burkholderiaceae bacterium]
MSGNTDAALIYQRTEKGEELMRAGARALGHVARRILPMIDGRRRVADLPENVRPGDLEAAITELQTLGLIRFTGRADPLDAQDLLAQQEADQILLSQVKNDLNGLFVREMGPPGEIWDARVADTVSMVVLRRVLREAIDVSYFRSGSEVARNLVEIVRPIFRSGNKPQ